MEVCSSKASYDAQGAAHVLGFACRLPESSNASEFWRNLSTGVDNRLRCDGFSFLMGPAELEASESDVVLHASVPILSASVGACERAEALVQV